MEKASIIFSILIHDTGFMSLFCLLATLPLAFGQAIYFWVKRKKDGVSEKKLVEISQKYVGINSRFLSFYFLWSLFLMGYLAAFTKINGWLAERYSIFFYPIAAGIFVSYGIFQGLFAIYSGVYPVSLRPLSFVHDEYETIKTVAKFHISISIFVYVLFVFFYFMTVK